MQVSSHSMEPTLRDGDYVLVAKNFSWFSSYLWRQGFAVRSRIAILRPPVESDSLLIKRIIAVGGETVRIKNGSVIVNGQSIHEPYLSLNTISSSVSESWPLDFGSPGSRPIAVPDRTFFVLGDNRSASFDSRGFGPVREDQIVGVVVATVHQSSLH